MISAKYLDIIKKIVLDELGDSEIKCFVFGSSLIRQRFGDVDLAVMGKVSRKKISSLKERFEASTLPFAVDVVDFNQAGDDFKANVFNQEILWIKR